MATESFQDTFNRLFKGTRVANNPGTPVETSITNQIKASTGRKPNVSPKKSGVKTEKAAARKITDQEKQDFLKARADELKSPDQPWYKDVLGAVGSPVVKALDLLGRPQASIFGGVNRSLEAIKDGDPLWATGDDFASGSWGGLSGKTRDGYGDILNTAKAIVRETDRSGTDNLDWTNSLFRKALNATPARASTVLDSRYGKDSWQANYYDNTVGFVGDMTLDPINVVGAGAVTKPINAAKGLRTGVRGEAAVEAVARNAVDDVAGQLGKDLNVPASLRDEMIDTTTGKKTSELLESADPVEVKSGQNLKALEDQALQGEARAAKLISDYETGKITADDFFKEYQKPGSYRGGGIQKIISDAKKFKRPTQQVVDEIITIRKPQIGKMTKTLGQTIQELIEDRTPFLINEVNSRTQAGKIVGGVGKDYTNTVSNLITEGFRDQILATTRSNVNKFKGVISKNRVLTKSQIDNMRASDPYFKVWHDEFLKLNTSKAAALTDPQSIKAIAKADEAVQKAVLSESTDIASRVKGAMTDQLMKVPTLRMMGRDVVEFPRIGKKLHSASNKVKAVPAVDNFRNAFSFTANFPGYTSLISQKVKSIGVQRFEKVRDEIIAEIKDSGITRQQRKDVTEALVKGLPPGDPTMNRAYYFIKNKYDEILADEIQDGVRDIQKRGRVDNYVYTHIKGGGDVKRWSQKKANDLNNRPVRNLDGYTPADLKAQNFRIEADAFANLLIRQQRSIRKRTSNAFELDLVRHYGMRSSMTDAEAFSRGLEKVKLNTITNLEGVKLKPGENMWIDKSIKDVHRKYLDMAKIQAGDDLKDLVKTFDWVTRKFKTWNTIYFPGYHMRNMVGDMLMGLMDGVKSDDYRKIFGAMFDGRGGNISASNIKLAGSNVKFDEFILSAYKNNLTASSFLNADLGGSMAVKGRTIPSGVRALSETREDFGRITHFYRAMDDELSANLRKIGATKFDPNIPSHMKAYDSAINTASFRVNKFKFDYDALTAVEKKYVRRGIPFYTYLRKAAPTLIESMALQPRYLGNMTKIQTGLEEQWGDDFQVPDWLRELGYMKLPFGDFGMTDEMLPTSALRNITDSPMSKINPIPGVAIESQTGRDSFTGQPISGDNAWEKGANSAMNKWRGFSSIADPRDDRNAGIFEDNDKSNWQKFFNFMGVPIRPNNEKLQDQAFAEMRYKLNNKLDEMKASIEKKGYAVYLSERNDGISLRIKDKLTDETIFEGQSLKEVAAFMDTL